MRKKILTLLVLLAAVVTGAVAQETLTVYDATDPDLNFHVPVRGLGASGYLKCEMVYPASEVRGMAGGTINKMMYYANVPAPAAWTGTFQVFMKEVTDASISSGYASRGRLYIRPASVRMKILFSSNHKFLILSIIDLLKWVHAHLNRKRTSFQILLIVWA